MSPARICTPTRLEMCTSSSQTDPKEIKIVGMIVTYKPDGIQYEPDRLHIEKVIYELGSGESNGVATSGVRDETTMSAVELLERRRWD